MANSKITDLSAIGSIASNDVLPIVDVSGTVTDKVTVADLLGFNISSGVLAPSSTPSALGQIYINTALGKVYISAGTTNSADWKLLN